MPCPRAASARVSTVIRPTDNVETISRRADLSFPLSWGPRDGLAAASSSATVDGLARGRLPVFVGRHPVCARTGSASRKTCADAQVHGFHARLPEQTAPQWPVTTILAAALPRKACYRSTAARIVVVGQIPPGFSSDLGFKESLMGFTVQTLVVRSYARVLDVAILLVQAA